MGMAMYGIGMWLCGAIMFGGPDHLNRRVVGGYLVGIALITGGVIIANLE